MKAEEPNTSGPGVAMAEKVQLRDLLECVVERAGGFLWEQVGLPAEFGDPEEPRRDEENHMMANFTVTGSLEGRIAVRAADGVVRKILTAMIPEPVPAEEENLMLQETLKETLNIIIGSSTDMLRKRGYPIEVFPPFATSEEDSGAIYEEDFEMLLHTQSGSMHFILSIVSR